MEEQFDVHSAPLKGQMVIEASAGTGKTHSIVQLYLRLLVERRLNPEQILVVTFTDAATGELKERIRSSVSLLSRELKGEKSFSDKDTYASELLASMSDEQKKSLPLFIDAALNSFDEASIFTIHGFCRRVLRDHAFEYNTIFNSELIDDIIPIAEEITIDYYRKSFYGASRFFVEAASSRKISVGALMNLLCEVLPKTDLCIIPDDDEWKKIDLYGDKLRAAFDRAKKVWDKSGISLKSLFENGGLPLNGHSYRVNDMKGRFADIDEYFLNDNYADSLPERVKYFLPEFILSKYDPKKKGSLDDLTVHPAIRALESLHSEHSDISQKIDYAFSSLRASYLRFAKRELEKRKELRNLWSFDDLLSGVRKGLSDPLHGGDIAFALRKRYPVALIDEFQDTDAVQCDIFEKIFNHPDSMLYYIGDPKQAIYTFRGADVHAYIAAKKGKLVRYKGENWRSHEKLVNAVNAIFSADDPFMLGDEIAYKPVGSCADKGELVVEGSASPMVVWTISGDEEGKPYSKALTLSMIRRAVANELSRLLTSAQQNKTYFSEKGKMIRPLKAGDCAVIVRTNGDALAMKETLRAQSIPSVIARSGSVYESPMKRSLDLFLHAVDEGREGLIRAALASDLFLCDAETIANLTEDPAKWETYLESFREYRIIWERFGFMSLVSAAIRNGIYENVARSGDGVRKLADLIHLIELYHRAVVEGGFGPVELLAWSAKKEADERSRSDEHRTRLETDDDAVKIVTVHAAKGLEYPVVFTVSGWEFRDDRKKIERVFYHDNDALVCDLTVKDREDTRAVRAEIEERAESLRLYYVALTRASHRCYTVAGKIKGYENSAAGYLFHSGRVTRSGGNANPDSRIERYQHISSIIKDLSFEDIVGDLGNVAAKGEFLVAELPLERGSVFNSGTDEIHDLVARQAAREIRDDWKISSFSYIVAARSDDHEIEYDDDAAASSGSEHQEPVFPKGPEAGSCIHGIFEILDYSAKIDDDTRQEIGAVLAQYNLDQKERAEWVEQLCTEVFAKKLPITGQSLGSIAREKQVRELEFYFPAQYISAASFKDMLLKELGKSFNSGFTREISLITFERFAGFLKGFMDLTFEHEGKYYILDWKTNYLGESAADYSYRNLCREMDRHLYTVQAIIYSLALHLFLKSRLKEYRYESHFGGVIYLFVRGMNSVGNEGIWEWRPDQTLIDMLDSKIVRRNPHE